VVLVVQALVELDLHTNRVLNVVKAKYDLNDKGEAIKFVVRRFVDLEEPALRPEFIEKMKKLEKQKSVRVNDLAERYGLNVRP